MEQARDRIIDRLYKLSYQYFGPDWEGEMYQRMKEIAIRESQYRQAEEMMTSWKTTPEQVKRQVYDGNFFPQHVLGKKPRITDITSS